MSDETNKTLTEDEQWAALTKDNPLFDDGRPDRSVGADKPDGGEAGDAGGDDQDQGAPGDGDGLEGGQGDAPGGDADGTRSDDTGNGDGDADGAGGEEPFPGYNAMAPEVREAVDKLSADRDKALNDYKALHGMTAPLQRGNAELRRQLEAQQARIQQLEQVGRKQQDVSAAKEQALQEFDEWAKQYPEESRAIMAVVNPLREKVTALEGSLHAARAELGSLHEDRQQAALAREIGELEKVHPDWRQVHNSPDYQEWLNQQPPGIHGLANSMFAGDTIHLLNIFKGSRAPVDPNPPPATQTTPDANRADAVQKRRSQALARGTQPAVRTSESPARGGANPGDLSDEDAQFLALVEGNPLFR